MRDNNNSLMEVVMKWIDVNEKLPEPVLLSEWDNDIRSRVPQKHYVLVLAKETRLSQKYEQYYVITMKLAIYLYDEKTQECGWYGINIDDCEILFWTKIPEYPDIDLMAVKGLKYE